MYVYFVYHIYKLNVSLYVYTPLLRKFAVKSEKKFEKSEKSCIFLQI